MTETEEFLKAVDAEIAAIKAEIAALNQLLVFYEYHSIEMWRESKVIEELKELKDQLHKLNLKQKDILIKGDI